MFKRFMTMSTTLASIFIFLSIYCVVTTYARKPHVINFRSNNLFPESFVWDPKAQHFIVGSLRQTTLQSVSDAGVVESLITDTSLPENSSFLGLFLDRYYANRILAVIHSPPTSSSPPFNALAAYDLTSLGRLFLTPLTYDNNDPTTYDLANDVVGDFYGNAYVTNSHADIIWKVNSKGEASILSSSKAFKSHTVDTSVPYHKCGLNGVVYSSKGYLLVVQSNTGKLFKVDVEDGTARTVILNKDLTAADGMAVRSDGVLVVVSQQKLYYVKSNDGWSEGVVFDETALDAEKQASAVVAGEEGRVYVLYGYVNEGSLVNAERGEFSIAEVESEVEKKEDNIWIFVLIGIGLAYLLFWRFQMRHLVENLNKKTS